MKELTTGFSFSFSDLLEAAKKIILAYSRDKAELSVVGIDPSEAANLQRAYDDFEKTPTDEEMEGCKIALTTKKSALKENVEVNLTKVREFVRNTKGEDSKEYLELDISKIRGQRDYELLRVAIRVVRLLDVTGNPILQGVLQELNNNLTAYELSLDNVTDAELARDISTRERRLTANRLYNLVVRIAEAGKAYYGSIAPDDARYNDYLIFPTAPETTEGGNEEKP